jgi:hypothetical protein
MSELSNENGEQRDERTIEQRMESLESALSVLAQLYGALMNSYATTMEEFREHRTSIEYLLITKPSTIH